MLAPVARRLILRQKNHYAAPIPDTGPLLLLGNHTAQLDPVVMALGMKRHVHFMASEALFRVPRLGGLLRRLGVFPKAKYARDPESIERAVALNAEGRVVGLFPEGNRSWDGRPEPVLAGLGWLIRKLNGPTVFVLNRSSWLMQPRWARYPRFVPTVLEFSEPVVFPEDWSTSRIEQEVAQRLALDITAVKLPGWAWGFRMAYGLPDYLWACPACFKTDALQVDPQDGNGVRCKACQVGWRLDVMQHLHPRKDEPALTVATAFDRIIAHFGELPTLDPDRFVAEGIALEDSNMRVFRVVEGSEPVSVASGPARLMADALRVGAGESPWELPFEDIKAVSIEVGNRLQLRSSSELYELQPNDGSPLKWGHFLKAHQGRSRPTRRGRKR